MLFVSESELVSQDRASLFLLVPLFILNFAILTPGFKAAPLF